MVGKEEGSASVNLKKSQDDFQKKLERKFRDIQKYADSLLTHSEVDNVLLELMLSDESLRSAVLGLLLEKFSPNIVETDTKGGHQHDLSTVGNFRGSQGINNIQTFVFFITSCTKGVKAGSSRLETCTGGHLPKV